MQELTTQQKFTASLEQGNRALAELYLTDLIRYDYDSSSVGVGCFERIENQFGLITAAEVASRIYRKLSENARQLWQRKVAAGFLRDRSAALFQETTSGLARKVAHVLLEESRSILGRPTLNLDQLCAAWTPEHIEANPAEAARTAILGGSAPLFSQALDVCARKDGIVAAVALIEEGLPRTSLFSPPSPLLPAMTGFLRNHITRHAAATSGKAALDQILSLNRHAVADSAADQDLTLATKTLMKDRPSEEVLDLVQPALSGNCGNTLKAPTSLGKTLSSLQEQAWTNYVTDLRNNGMKPGKVLLQLANRIKRMTDYSRIRPQAVRDYIAALQAIPDPNLAVHLATRHLRITDKQGIFCTNESTAIATAARNLLTACDLTDKPEDWLKPLGILFHFQEGTTDKTAALPSGLTVTLNALAQKDPRSALQEAIKLGEQAFTSGHYPVDRAAAAVVETTASLLAERNGPATALEMLLASYSPNYGFERRPAVEYALSRSIRTLEQQVFPPALQPPVAA